MLTVTLLLWTMAVAMVPTVKPISIPFRPPLLNKKSFLMTSWASGGIASFIRTRPKKSIPKPSKIRPLSLILALLKKRCRTMPSPIAGRAHWSGLKATSWLVTVVPIFAPRITPTDWKKSIRPALMKPTTMTVVALLLWRMPVTMVPRSKP